MEARINDSKGLQAYKRGKTSLQEGKLAYSFGKFISQMRSGYLEFIQPKNANFASFSGEDKRCAAVLPSYSGSLST